MEKKIKIGDTSFNVSTDDKYLAGIGETFEPEMVALFKALIKPTDVVADVGANIGLTALLFSTIARKVYAFEPAPTTFGLLISNLDRANLKNVVPVNLGLGDTNEQMTITYAATNRSGAFVSDQVKIAGGHVTENITINTLDAVFEDIGELPNFIKIDVEGFEGKVLAGARTVLHEKKPTVVLEVNHFCLNVFRRTSLPDFFDQLRSIFPYIYAVDIDNSTVLDLHDSEQSYRIMYEHITRQRFPNVAAGFDQDLILRLKKLTAQTSGKQIISDNATPRVQNPKGNIIIKTPMPEVTHDQPFELAVELSNTSGIEWRSDGDCPVLLCYHWKSILGNSVIYDGIRTVLSDGKLDTGQAAPQCMQIMPPSKPGRYQLILTLVQEHITWFEKIGFTPTKYSIKVK